MSDWKTLTAISLLGTERAAAEYPLPPAVEALLPAGCPPETRLLRAAWVLHLLEITTLGEAPALEELPAPAGDETGQTVGSGELADLLRTIIMEGHAALIREACALLAEHNALLPPALIPAALEHARKSKALREPVRKAAGKRGAWLAAQNPAWKFSAATETEDTDPAVWATGTLAQREIYLAHVHRHDPAAAHALIQAAFPEESAANRAALLGALFPSVTVADELLLAGLLAQDRSKEVRALAATALSRLPESALAQRMAARLAPLIRLERKLLGKSLRLEPPAEFTPDMAADTLEPKPPGGKGERAWWLQQIVSFTPLTWWKSHLGLEPAEFLSQANKAEWLKPVLAGLNTAILRQPGQHEWAEAILETGWLPDQEHLVLALTLPPDRRQRVFLQMLKSAQKPADMLDQLAHHVEGEFSPALWETIRERLPAMLATDNWRFRETLRALAPRVPQAALRAEVLLPNAPLFTEATAEFLRQIDQRRALHRLIATASATASTHNV